MKSREELLTIVAEIRQELADLAVLKEDIEQAQDKIQSASQEDRPYFLESAALKLHNFYTACERIFERIAGEINGGTPDTYDWHRRLLKNMSLEIPTIRPIVISKDLEKELEEYLKFRHLVRNIYGFELDFERMGPLIRGVSEVFDKLSQEIGTFLSFLEELAENI